MKGVIRMADKEEFRGQVAHFTRVAGSLFPDQQEEMVAALNADERRGTLLSSLQSLAFSPPEIRANKARNMYEICGWREFLTERLALDRKERLSFINELAGEEVAKIRSKG